MMDLSSGNFIGSLSDDALDCYYGMSVLSDDCCGDWIMMMGLLFAD